MVYTYLDEGIMEFIPSSLRRVGNSSGAHPMRIARRIDRRKDRPLTDGWLRGLKTTMGSNRWPSVGQSVKLLSDFQRVLWLVKRCHE